MGFRTSRRVAPPEFPVNAGDRGGGEAGGLASAEEGFIFHSCACNQRFINAGSVFDCGFCARAVYTEQFQQAIEFGWGARFFQGKEAGLQQ
jgi:hypothetical protein